MPAKYPMKKSNVKVRVYGQQDQYQVPAEVQAQMDAMKAQQAASVPQDVKQASGGANLQMSGEQMPMKPVPMSPEKPLPQSKAVVTARGVMSDAELKSKGARRKYPKSK